MAEVIRTPLTVVHVIACVFLILVVLLQPGKGGGLGGLGAGAQQVFGGRGAGNFLTKTTWATAAVFFATSMTLAFLSSSSDESLQKRSAHLVEKQKKLVPTPAATSSAPANNLSGPSPASPPQ